MLVLYICSCLMESIVGLSEKRFSCCNNHYACNFCQGILLSELNFFSENHQYTRIWTWMKYTLQLKLATSASTNSYIVKTFSVSVYVLSLSLSTYGCQWIYMCSNLQIILGIKNINLQFCLKNSFLDNSPMQFSPTVTCAHMVSFYISQFGNISLITYT